jgi:AcrR family transcriptional regulator
LRTNEYNLCMVKRMMNTPVNQNKTFDPRSTGVAEQRPEGSLAAGAAGLPVEVPAPPNDGLAYPVDARLLDQSGRPLGRRAIATRTRILAATRQLLNEKSLRDLRVIDIARLVGTSPATFYQYFKDVRDVVLELAIEVSESVPDLVAVIEEGDWKGREGHERGKHLARLVLDYWEHDAAILRIRNNAADEGAEGDPGFSKIRIGALMPMVTAFAKIIGASQAAAEGDATGDEWKGGRLHPIAAGMVLTASLEQMAIHRKRFEQRFTTVGEGCDEIVETIATVIQQALTAGR